MDHKGTLEFYLLNHKKQSIEQMVYAILFIFFTKRSVGDVVFMLCDVVTAWCRPGEERQKSGGLVPGMGSIRQPSHSAGGSRAPAPPPGEEYRLTFY